jgi:hypothetical protein
MKSINLVYFSAFMNFCFMASRVVKVFSPLLDLPAALLFVSQTTYPSPNFL